jgi:hypothetical protein
VLDDRQIAIARTVVGSKRHLRPSSCLLIRQLIYETNACTPPIRARREQCGGWGRDEGSYVVCNIIHVIAYDGVACGWWRVEDGKQHSKRVDAPKDNREHVFACQSETDAELRVV